MGNGQKEFVAFGIDLAECGDAKTKMIAVMQMAD